MKIVKLSPSKLQGELEIPSAKAYAHRYILASFLAEKKVELIGNFQGDDVRYSLNAIECLGAKVSTFGDKSIKRIVIDKNHNNVVNPYNNDVLTIGIGESGSSLRFLIPICAALNKHVIINGEGRLSERPIDELVNVLEDNGVTFKSRVLPLEFYGALQAGDYKINPSKSSQYVTGLLLALPILKGDSRIIFTGQATSMPYIKMTLEVLSKFGIKINKEKYGFYIPGNQTYVSNKSYYIESDWSSAGYFSLLGTHFGNMSLSGLNNNSLQGDKKIIEILKQMGADIRIDNNKYYFNKSHLKATEINVSDIPDMAPLLAVAFVISNGEGRLISVDRLRIKESDRLQAIMDMLDAVGTKYEYSNEDNGTLVIHGNTYKETNNVHFKGCNDHRIVMCQAVLSLILNISSTIEYAQSVNKSFPSFFHSLEELGAEVEVKNE